MLTTASLSGSWVPEISRSFHYWQPAPRMGSLPWLANPGKPAMSPQALEGGQTPVKLIKQWKMTEGRGEGRGKTEASWHQKSATQTLAIGLRSKNVIYSVSTWTPGACAQRDTTGHGATLALFVVNSVKLHLTTLF